MQHSLSILLCLHDAEANLAATLLRVVDIAADLTPDLEILLVDNGSRDQTFDVARRLTMQFPQVRVVRHAECLELTEVVRDGLDRTHGEIVLMHDGRAPIDVSDIGPLWQLRDDAALVVARRSRTAEPAETNWLERVLRISPPAEPERSRSGFRLLRRAALESLQAAAAGPPALAASESQVRLIRTDAAAPRRASRAAPLSMPVIPPLPTALTMPPTGHTTG